MIKELNIATLNQGLFEITNAIKKIVNEANGTSGLCTIFIKHTSASLLIQENADPSARRDLENWLTRLVPENDAIYTHVAEGSDDMPAHIKSMLTATNVSIPIVDGNLALGIWQGIFVFEHRYGENHRTVLVHVSMD